MHNHFGFLQQTAHAPHVLNSASGQPAVRAFSVQVQEKLLLSREAVFPLWSNFFNPIFFKKNGY
jgi:hypothetical protein